VTGDGSIYVTDVNKKAVRKIDGNTGSVSTLTLPAGNEYTGLGIDSAGRLLIANFTDNAILRESAAGNGSFANYVTGLNKPRDVAGAPDGSAYVTNSGNHRIVRIDPSGAKSDIAGSGQGFGGDGGAVSIGMINLAAPALVLKAPDTLATETVNIVLG